MNRKPIRVLVRVAVSIAAAFVVAVAVVVGTRLFVRGVDGSNTGEIVSGLFVWSVVVGGLSTLIWRNTE